MKLFGLFGVLALLLFSCSAPEKPKASHKKSEQLIFENRTMVSAGQMMPFREIKFQGHSFNLVIGENDTVYLSTFENDFLTPEKYHTGMKFSEIQARFRNNVQKEDGWAYYIPLPSGWNLGFCEGPGCTDVALMDTSQIKWIFKRKI